MEIIFEEIKEERKRQDKKWGIQNHKPIEWMSILMEEVGETSKEALEYHFKDPGLKGIYRLENYKKELIQIAAVAIAMLESFDRNESKIIEKQKEINKDVIK